MQLSLPIIGKIHSCYKDRFGVPRQPGLIEEAKSYLEISSEFQPEFSLEGLADFSHAWVLFYFHEAQQKRFHAKVHPPRLNGKSVGVFATRSPHRPSPIGLSLVKIEKIDGDRVYMAGGDFLDGTPVFDIKPYHVEVEAIPAATKGWMNHVDPNAQKEIEIYWETEAKEKAQSWALQTERQELLTLIEKTIALDPRPLVYKNAKNAYQMTHAFRLYEGDIHFIFDTVNSVRITKIEVD